MALDLELSFTAQLWLYGGKASWYFVTVPAEESASVRFFWQRKPRGWGAVPVTVTIGATTWKTSIFPNKQEGTYLLPVKADVRKSESLHLGQDIPVTIKIIP